MDLSQCMCTGCLDNNVLFDVCKFKHLPLYNEATSVHLDTEITSWKIFLFCLEHGLETTNEQVSSHENFERFN